MSIIWMFFTIVPIIMAVYGVSYFVISYKTYIYIFVLTAIIGIVLLKDYEQYLMPVIVLIIFVMLYRQIRSLHALIITCISTIIMFIGNAVIGITSIVILDITVEMFRESLMLYILSCIVGGVFTFFLGLAFRRVAIKHVKNYSLSLKNKNYLYMFLLLIVTVIMFYLNVVVFGSDNYKDTQKFMIFQIAFCVGYSMIMCLVFYELNKLLKKEYEMKVKEKEHQNMREYTENLEVLYNEMRGFRHDYANILSSMSGYIEENDLDGLTKFFNKDIVKMHTELEKRNSKIGVLQNIKIPEIKGLISSKIIRAQEIGIDVDLEIVEKIEKINIDVVPLCRMLGIILDNAIEELENCSNKQMKFALIKKGVRIIIVVSNMCREDSPPIFKVFEKGFSTKGRDRGVGLSNLKDMLRKYPKATLETRIIENEFIQCIEVCGGE